MTLFENNMLNISCIHTVGLFGKENYTLKSRSYNVNLYSYELIFNFSGISEVDFAGSHFIEEANSLRYLPKGKNSGEYTVNRIEPGFCIDVFFDTNDPMPDTALVFNNIEELKNPFLKIYNIWTAKKPGYYYESMSVFYEILKKIKAHNEVYITTSQSSKIVPSYDYMIENFTNPDFNYKELASRLGLSYDYFKELFKKRFGVSPVKFVTHLRIEKAKELLITNRYKVNEIAYMCGYENVYYFSKVFKEHTGVSPKNYNKI